MIPWENAKHEQTKPGSESVTQTNEESTILGRRLKRGVDMIDIANGCAKRTYRSDFGRNRCVNHHYFLICTQGKS